MGSRLLTNRDQVFRDESGSPQGGLFIQLQIVDANSHQPTDCFDYVSKEHILPQLINTTSNSIPPVEAEDLQIGEININLLSTETFSPPVVYCVNVYGGPSCRTFYCELPSGENPITWFDFINGTDKGILGDSGMSAITGDSGAIISGDGEIL